MGLISRVSSRTYRAQESSKHENPTSTPPSTSQRQAPCPKTLEIRFRRNGSPNQPRHLGLSSRRIRSHVLPKTIHELDLWPSFVEQHGLCRNLLLVCCW